MTIQKVYERFKHLDRLLSENSKDPFRKTLRALWEAVKENAAIPEQPSAGEDVTPAILSTLEVMKKDFDWHRANTGMDPTAQSEEMELMEKLLDDLRAGRIICRRIS